MTFFFYITGTRNSGIKKRFCERYEQTRKPPCKAATKRVNEKIPGLRRGGNERTGGMETTLKKNVFRAVGAEARGPGADCRVPPGANHGEFETHQCHSVGVQGHEGALHVSPEGRQGIIFFWWWWWKKKILFVAD